MQNPKQIKAAATAAIKKANKLSADLVQHTYQLLKGDADEAAKIMPKVRAKLAELNQRMHEFNAYSNCLTTGEPPKPKK